MATTSDPVESTRRTAVVSVRCPNGGEADLATTVERRVGRVDGVRDVAVEGLRGVEPGLSATTTTAEVSVESALSPAVLRERLRNAVAVEGIREFDAV